MHLSYYRLTVITIGNMKYLTAQHGITAVASGVSDSHDRHNLLSSFLLSKTRNWKRYYRLNITILAFKFGRATKESNKPMYKYNI